MKLSKKIILSLSIATILLCSPALTALAIPIPQGSYLSLDFSNSDALPKNFRKTTDLSKVSDNTDKTGLDTLNISGSSQPTALSFNALKNNIGNTKNITIVDLRQESHGFINGNAISWVGDINNKANGGLTLEEVIKKENNQLKSIPFGKPISLDKGKYTLIPTEICNEQTLTTKEGLKYFRITVTDTERPTDLMVDRFITFINEKPKDAWLHFHCKEGDGRTTTFMVMYDMMENSKNVSFASIVERQYELGGYNIYDVNSEKTRTKFIENFYKYTKENDDNFKTTWSEWIVKNDIFPFTVEDEK